MKKFFILCVLTLGLAGSVMSQRVIQGEVIEVIDGKTLIITNGTTKFRVELQYIEVPMPGQPMADIVTGHLKKLALGKVAEYRPRSLSLAGASGEVTLDGVDLSQQMLRDGAAWLIPAANSSQTAANGEDYRNAETAAKNERRGVWSVPELNPPWQVQREADDAHAVKRVPKPISKWGDKNPKLGDVGALLHGYNAASRTGYVSTTPTGVALLHDEGSPVRKIEVDFTYIYTETDEGRQGTFHFNFVTAARRCRFERDSDLVFLGDSRKTVIAKARRSTYTEGELCWEQLKYKIPRSTVYRLVNSRHSGLRLGAREIYYPLKGMQLLLLNMLDVSQ